MIISLMYVYLLLFIIFVFLFLNTIVYIIYHKDAQCEIKKK